MDSALKGFLAAMVAVVWLVRENPAPVFTCGGMVCERSRQPGHAGHGVEYQIREESFCLGTYRWAKNLALSS